jgi:hypothetical protein
VHIRLLSARLFSVLALLLLLFYVSPLLAQEDSARISGLITDQQKAVIRNAKVDLINLDTGVHYPTVSNQDGVYVISAPIGNYRLQIDHPGFKTVIAANIVLHTQDAREINFELAVGSTNESVTVNGETTNDSPAVSMTVDREFVENMPLNGQSFQDLIQLAPGTVSTQTGYYSIDGQRTDSNNYTVDGVSANLGGYNNASGEGFSLSGNTPAQTIVGTTQSLASVDSLQEFTIQTSGYAAEFGRSPGGQVELTTRSGTNALHGTLFEYLRNTAFDANSFFNDYYGDPQTAEHQNDFGGTIGGPFTIPRFYSGKDRTFYLFSFEGLRLLLPGSESEYVPTQTFRAAASPNVQPFLDEKPLPNPNSAGNNDGCTVNGMPNGPACDAFFYLGYSAPSAVTNTSIRFDENLTKSIHAFVRYADTPSSTRNGGEDQYTQATNTHTWTVGLTANVTAHVINETRFNYSHDGEEYLYVEVPIDGSTPQPRNLLIPAEYDAPSASSFFIYRASGDLSGRSTYGGGGSTQHQYQVVDALTYDHNHHTLKVGIDWRRLSPTFANDTYESLAEALSLAALQQGFVTVALTDASAPGHPIFDNLSVYVQDHFRVGQTLSLDYGLRWEFNPPPGPSNGHYPVTLTSANLATAQLAPVGTPPYETDYHSFAPRFGFEWNATPSSRYALTVRGGAGIFFDTGQSVIGSAYADAYPFFASSSISRNVPLPLSATVLAPPSLSFPLTPPYPILEGISSPNLTMPYTESWNLSIDEKLSPTNTVTASYIGNNGKKLLFTEDYYTSINPSFANGLYYTSNASQSSYNALQVQDSGRIAGGVALLASFTFAHALDNESSDIPSNAPTWGNSTNDLRRVFNLALNYQAPACSWNHWLVSVTHGWLLANRFSTQSGYPLDIVQTDVTLPDGSSAQYYPDLVTGVPIYLHGSAAHNTAVTPPYTLNWALNPNAFAAVPIDPTTGNPTRQGTLGRNFVRAPAFWALNTSLQRTFPLREQLHLNFRTDAFNIFNHPNLGNPDTNLYDSTFGELINGVTTIGSSNTLYAMGAARSLQFSLKLQF